MAARKALWERRRLGRLRVAPSQKSEHGNQVASRGSADHGDVTALSAAFGSTPRRSPTARATVRRPVRLIKGCSSVCCFSISPASARCSLSPPPSPTHPLAEEWSGAKDADQRSTHRRLIGNTPWCTPFFSGKERCWLLPLLRNALSVLFVSLSQSGGKKGARSLRLSVGSIF
ncbi:hypothetical protein CEXT_261421 [Caerostris extrusa]|uniref:Uncharacterized protein n=1 Tax=Caerostris extrusa TaxID=172846 RepID=A0AAV4U0G1_CAEEX|nr:hypothetical protein CEXT_261421 [Caerostris extrusa]